MVASRHPRLLQLPVLIASLALVLATLGACAPAPASTPPAAAPRGASVDGAAAGTVKIHDGNTESEGPANNPKVCQFHIHFFLGAGTSGTWRIDTQPGGQTVLRGMWASSAADVRVPPYPDLHSLPDGQYKLFWSQDGQPGGDKQKVFKVDCSSSGVTPTSSPTPTRTPSPTATTTASPTASAEPSATPGPTEEPSAVPTEQPSQQPGESPEQSSSAEPEVTPSPSAAPSAVPSDTPAPTPTPSAKPSASASPSGSVEPESTASASTPTGPGGSVEGEDTAKPTGAPDTSAAPGTAQSQTTDVTLLLLVLSFLAAAALVVPRPARRR